MNLWEMGLAEQAAPLNSFLESSTQCPIVAKGMDGTSLAWNEGGWRMRTQGSGPGPRRLHYDRNDLGRR